MSNVHSVAADGFGTGKGALYDRARPSYPLEALQAIRDSLRTAGPFNVLELGAGTGIFTRALLAHPAWTTDIAALRAVEPSDDFRAVLDKSVSDDHRVTTASGTFDNTAVQDGWGDAIIVAQAWHWCPDHEAAMAEFARVLKPNGVAFFIWNLEDRDAATWVARLRSTIEEHEKGTPQFRLGLWRATFAASNYLSNFEKEEELVWSYNLEGTKESVVDRACSKSYITTLPDGVKSQVVKTVEQILDEEPKTWIREEDGVFEYPYKTTLVMMRRK